MLQLTAQDLLSKIFLVKECNENVSQFEPHPNEDYAAIGEEASVFSSWLGGDCKIVADGIQILFGWDASANQSESYNDAFDFEVSLGDPCYWEIRGANIVDENGEDTLDPREWIEAIRSVIETTDWESHVNELLPEPKVEEIKEEDAMTIDIEMMTKEWKVPRDNGPTIKFKGYVLGTAESSENNAHSNWSGKTGRWKELCLYKTQGGKYICEEIGRTQWQGERHRYKAAICETIAQVQEFFGHGWLAKQLYVDAEIDASQHVE